MKCLFISGIADGRWMEVEDHTNPVMVPIPPSPMATTPDDVSEVIQLQRYDPCRFRAGGYEVTIYVARGLDAEYILRELILNYVRIHDA